MDRTLTWFARVWIGVVVIVTLVSWTGTMIGAPTVWSGLLEIRDEIEPLNYQFYLMMGLFLTPALLAIGWRDSRRAKRSV